MKQDERRKWLIRNLLDENMHYREYEVSDDTQEQKKMLRSLMNVRIGCRLPCYIQADEAGRGI